MVNPCGAPVCTHRMAKSPVLFNASAYAIISSPRQSWFASKLLCDGKPFTFPIVGDKERVLPHDQLRIWVNINSKQSPAV